MSEKINPEVSGRAIPRGYPVRILGRFAMHPKEVLSEGVIPTADDIVKVACEAVKFTQKANSFPGAIITGRHITAAPESARNGSIFLPISDVGKARSLDLFRRLLPDDPSALDRAEGVGVYVTSDKKRARDTDIREVGIVLCDESAERISETVMTRQAIGELSDPQRQQLGELLSVIALGADMAYGFKLHQLAH